MAVTNDIVRDIGKKLNHPTFKSRAYLKAITDMIAERLQEGDKVEIPTLGTFRLLRLPSRKVEATLAGKRQTIKLDASITPDFEVEKTLQEEIKKPTALADREATDEFRVSSVHTRKSDIQFIELSGKTIPKTILSLVPEAIARKYQAVPFNLEEKTLSIAMTDPENEEAFNAIRKVSGKIVKSFLSTQEDVSYILDQYSGLQSELKELVENEDISDIDTVEEKEEKVTDEDITETSPAAKIVSSLLKRSVREKASDIHIEPTEEDVQVRFRIDGVLRKILALPKEIQPGLISRIKILSNLKIDETRLPQDGRIQILLDGNKIDFRISTLPTVNGEKVVARVLDHTKGVLTLDQLGVRGRAFQVLEDNIKKAHGMTLVTGPTGSGKSTTLYAIVSKIMDTSINIITMEDPVEYRMAGVNQSQVNSKIGFDFANGLRSILRQDPDVVMVGEIRDKETADIAINAALTGHVVLSSLHTNDSAGALPRLLDMGIESFLITSSTNAIVAQRLCRKICEKCRQEVKIKPEDTELIKTEIESLPEPERSDAKKKNAFYAGSGCSTCGNTGYKGRIGIFEILGVTETVKQLTLKRASGSDILTQAKKEGLITMRQDGVMKALDGLTTIEEVWRVTKD